MKRLRIFDLNTPWFWVTVFFQRLYGKPWFELSLWKPHTFKRWWIYAWKWEPLPDERGAYSTMVGDTSGDAVLANSKQVRGVADPEAPDHGR